MTASIGSILSVARTALTANQAAIGVISHNLANATTEGDSRQRAELVAGRNDIAIALAGLRDAPVASLGNRSIASAYAAAVGPVGGDVRAAADSADTHQVLASQADVRRSSVSGVSVDEELVQLIRFQNAYSAAARIVTAADEMLQTILDMKR